MTLNGNRESPLVLHVRSAAGTGGGPEKTIFNSPRWLRRLGYRSECVYLCPPRADTQPLREFARRCDAGLKILDDHGPFDVNLIRELARICRARGVDIWHAHDYKTTCLGLIVRQFAPLRLVTTIHGWGVSGGRNEWYYWLEKKCLPYYDAVLAVSQKLYDECLRVGTPPQRLKLVHNAIDIEAFTRSQSTATAKRALGLPTNEIAIGAVGRLSPEKGYLGLVEAVAQIRNQGAAVQLYIAGEGPERARLETKCQDLNIAPFVHLLGYVTEIRPWFESFDVFVLSSIKEGLPNVVLEAMALEVPLVATRVEGVPDLVEHRQNGVVVEPNSMSELLDGISWLLAREDRGRGLAEAARRTIESRFSFSERMRRVALVYDGLLESGGAVAAASA